MTIEIAIVLVVAVIAVILFANDKLPVDLVAIFVMAVLLLTGIISPEEGIAGFSNTATVTVGAMFVLSAGLYRTGAVNSVGNLLARVGKYSTWLALITIMLSIGVISAFINNTAAVAIFLPIVLGMAKETGVSPSKLLIPLSFASMFGGVCTLIGTSTNILVNSIAERYGQPSFGMFEFSKLGLVFFGVGMVYMLVIGVRLIPSRRGGGDLTETFGMGDYLTEIELCPEARSVGKAVKDAPLVKEVDLAIMNLRRNGQSLGIPSPSTILLAGDELRVRTRVEEIAKLQQREGISIRPRKTFHDSDLQEEDLILVEAVVAANSPLVGRSLKGARFNTTYGGTALAIRHRETMVHEKIGTTRLRAGDALLIETTPNGLEQLKRSKAFVIVSDAGVPQFRRKRIIPALAIITGVVLLAALGIFPIVVSAIVGSVFMVITGCINLQEAYDAIEWKVIFLLAGVLTLGTALEKTGAAVLLSNQMVSILGQFGPVALMSAFYLMTSLMTESLSNNATAALVAPIAIATATAMGVDPRPFLFAVMFAASSSFMTPVGYQTNTMVFGAGQYKFSDFLRVGTPLNFLFWIIATIMIPQIWPF